MMRLPRSRAAAIARVALTAVAACRSSTAAPPGAELRAPAQADAAAALLRDTERTRVRALVAADTALAWQLHADDYQQINPAGGVRSKAEYLGAVASGELDYLLWEPDSIAVRWYGAAAVLRYQSQIALVVKGRRVPRRRYWHTDLYERRAGRWQVVWSHTTAIE